MTVEAFFPSVRVRSSVSEMILMSLSETSGSQPVSRVRPRSAMTNGIHTDWILRNMMRGYSLVFEGGFMLPANRLHLAGSCSAACRHSRTNGLSDSSYLSQALQVLNPLGVSSVEPSPPLLDARNTLWSACTFSRHHWRRSRCSLLLGVLRHPISPYHPNPPRTPSQD